MGDRIEYSRVETREEALASAGNLLHLLDNPELHTSLSFQMRLWLQHEERYIVLPVDVKAKVYCFCRAFVPELTRALDAMERFMGHERDRIIFEHTRALPDGGRTADLADEVILSQCKYLKDLHYLNLDTEALRERVAKTALTMEKMVKIGAGARQDREDNLIASLDEVRDQLDVAGLEIERLNDEFNAAGLNI